MCENTNSSKISVIYLVSQWNYFTRNFYKIYTKYRLLSKKTVFLIIGDMPLVFEGMSIVLYFHSVICILYILGTGQAHLLRSEEDMTVTTAESLYIPNRQFAILDTHFLFSLSDLEGSLTWFEPWPLRRPTTCWLYCQTPKAIVRQNLPQTYDAFSTKDP